MKQPKPSEVELSPEREASFLSVFRRLDSAAQEAIEKGYAPPIWMTFKQALEFKAYVRKGEEGSLVVYADKIIRTETDAATGEEAERAIPTGGQERPGFRAAREQRAKTSPPARHLEGHRRRDVRL
jgi:N-terminal domain of anti-restriction factor ArdC